MTAPPLERPYLDTAEAAAYLGFSTRNGIRQGVYRGELVPDGRGYRGGYVFLRETLDRFVTERLKRHADQAPGQREV